MDDIYYVYVLTLAILIKSDSRMSLLLILHNDIYLNSYRRINYLKKYTYRKFQVFFLHWGD